MEKRIRDLIFISPFVILLLDLMHDNKRHLLLLLYCFSSCFALETIIV